MAGWELVGICDVISVLDGTSNAERFGLGGVGADGALGGTVPVAHLPAGLGVGS